MKDPLAALLAFLFAEDKKVHSMSPKKAADMKKRIPNIAKKKTTKEEK